MGQPSAGGYAGRPAPLGLALARVWRRYGVAYLFVLPSLALYGLFKLYPFVGSIYLSLTSWDGAQPVPRFVGLDNYARLAADPLVWLSLGHNVLWMVLGMLLPVGIGLFLAVLLWGRPWGFTVFRTSYFLPVVVSSVIIGVIWGWIYHPIFGVLNQVLAWVGLGHLGRGWLGEPETALYAVIAAQVWSEIGFFFVIFLAGLQNVDVDLLDAAKIDGASAGQRFRHVTVPQLANVVTMVTSLALISGLNAFDLVFVMTGGGPAYATELIASYTYRMGFQENRVGYASALSMVITVLSLVITVAFIRFREREASG